MLDIGIIKESDSSWAPPAMQVPKKVKTVKCYVDYRKLNAITAPDAYPMPRIDDMLRYFALPNISNTITLVKGY